MNKLRNYWRAATAVTVCVMWFGILTDRRLAEFSGALGFLACEVFWFIRGPR